MSNLSSKLTNEDLETLMDAINDWEMLGNNDFYALNMIKTVPLPAEDHEMFRFIRDMKEHFRAQEKNIKAARAMRQEKAIFIKAKLVMTKQDGGIEQLFTEAAQTPVKSEVIEMKSSEAEVQQLQIAEEFIKDLGVWEHYNKFCLEHSQK